MATVELSRDQWLSARKQGVGASECAAVLGLSPWKTPLGLYLEKTGDVPPQVQSPRMKWGLLLESHIADEYRETHPELEKPPAILAHAMAPFCLASLDYWLPDRVVEIKTVNPYVANEFGEPGTDEIPKHYFLQVQQQMACAERDTADLVALFLGSYETHVYTIARRDDIIAELIEAEREFMDRVIRRDPPLPDFTHPSTADILAMIEPQSGSSCVLDEDAEVWVEAYQFLGGEITELKTKRDTAKAHIIHAMGTCEYGDLPDGRRVRRKEIPRKEYTVPASTYIDFRVTKGRT